jgi:hypothetical protein
MMKMLTAIGCLAAIVLIAASATMNYLFSISLGRSPLEGQVLGAVSVAVDILKALLVVFIAAAARDGRRGFVAIASAAFVLFTLGSLVAATGFTSVNRGAVTEARRSGVQAIRELEQTLVDRRKRLASLPEVRPLAVIEELLSGLQYDAGWAATAGCKMPTTTPQRFLCMQASTLRAERASAQAGHNLQAEIDDLVARMSKLRAASASSVNDPQARLMADMLRLDEGETQRLLMLLIALIVEVSSALGIYLVTGYRRLDTSSAVTASVPIAGETRVKAALAQDSSGHIAQASAGSADITADATGRTLARRKRAHLTVTVQDHNRSKDVS